MDISDEERQLNGKMCYKLNEKIPARLVLYFLSWSGFLVSFMMRTDMNFAVVEIGGSRNDESREQLQTTTISPKSSMVANMTMMVISDISTETAIVPDIIDTDSIDSNVFNEAKLYAWSTTVKSVIVSSYYWCYVLSQVVGGIATQNFGTKKVFGWSQFATAICSLCIPFLADYHYAGVIILRSIQGFASGLTWPAMYALVGQWIPLTERSQFMSSFQGFSIGIGLTYLISGFLIKYFGWRYVFYTTGSLGLLWCIAWYFFAFNTPKSHPRISSAELEYIETSISSEIKDSIGKKVPWQSIFTSMPALAIGITTFGRIWIHYTFIVCGPNFMKNILNFQYEDNGFLSGMPFLCSYISSVLFCYTADKMVSTRCMTLTNVRKVFTALSQIVPGILILFIGYVDQIALRLVAWYIAVTFITASYAGAMANIVDIAPNFAGSVLAFCQTIHMSASFLSPLIFGLIVTNETSIEQWRIVFGISSVVTICTFIVYPIFGTAKIQPWNYNHRDLECSPEESEILEKKN